MIFIGIDVAKDKHDCFICNSDGEVLYDVFTISNTMDGFNDLLCKIRSVTPNFSHGKSMSENVLVCCILFKPLNTKSKMLL